MADTARVTKSRKWKLFWSYLPDWVITILLWGLFYLLDKVNGYRRLFSITDESLAHPYAEDERVPVWLLAVLCGIVPLLLIIAMGAGIQRSFWDVHCGILGLALGLGLSQTLTTFIKITAGRPRPDLFARCQLPDSLTENPVHSLTSWTACERDDLLTDGFRSFPSGHSSFAWTGMWYLILYSAAKLRLMNRRGHVWKSWILLAPLTCAILVCISRTMDYRHHSTDVIAGGIIGVLAGWLAYRQFYPCLSDPRSYKPYSPRIAREEETIPLHTTHINEPRETFEDQARASLIPSQPPRAATGWSQVPKMRNGVQTDANGHALPQDGSARLGQPPGGLERISDTTLRDGAGV